MLKPVRYRQEELGFSLLETLVAMVISCLVCIAVMNTIPALFKQLYQAYFQYQLDREVRQVLINMEKDFRRIGYCSQVHCEGRALLVSEKFLSRKMNSCIIFAYDQDLSGSWVNGQGKKLESDFFGYRLNGHKLESNRNVVDCDGTRWQSLFDATLVKVNQLTFNWSSAKQLLEVHMNIESQRLPDKKFQYQIWVNVRNSL
ncbi:prepilin peptidase-dependent protein [Providencia rustigianii]|uniref:prepilin peptidase-dependent protein n=1 Tax=Providencia rustigianii TaxID=158850 RepID=UPI000F6FEF98|nr:prepilin peptidase-dependent protein [Providencia rustigianii]MTC58940.1 prepilin peptidase-dependent protein [Providencia rustigianii]VEH56456.1 Type II secretory pathway, component PulJ [Providencia rustigianii]